MDMVLTVGGLLTGSYLLLGTRSEGPTRTDRIVARMSAAWLMLIACGTVGYVVYLLATGTDFSFEVVVVAVASLGLFLLAYFGLCGARDRSHE
jgi:uncharacterized membrane protein YedE/YeeE